MRRPTFGGSIRPPHARPGSGYGRLPVPGPSGVWRSAPYYRMLAALDPVELVRALAEAAELPDSPGEHEEPASAT